MSQRDIAISVRHLSKSYVISHEADGKSRRSSTFRDVLADRLRHPIRKTPTETFWALEDVSFEVNKGDVVGIIGRNGAGKSTLLKILSRITKPTRGEIDVYGRVGSLLEVGTGFHSELTGRENIYLNGAILGMRRAEIRRQFDAIVDFAGVEQFLDTPVKRYSSGMYVRLAFGVAAHLQSEILIVDEVLAVGDTSFQKRCLGKMKDVSETGRTVLFVSHNMAAVQSLCKAVVVLKSGEVDCIGDPLESISRYLKHEDKRLSYVEGRGVNLSDRKNADAAGYPILRGVRILDEQGDDTQSLQTGATVSVRLVVEGLSQFPGADVGIFVRSEADQCLGHLSTAMFRKTLAESRTGGGIVEFNIGSFPFTPGTFWIDCYVAEEGIRYLDRAERAVQLSVVGADVYGSGYELKREYAVTVLDATVRWTTGCEPVAYEGLDAEASYGQRLETDPSGCPRYELVAYEGVDAETSDGQRPEMAPTGCPSCASAKLRFLGPSSFVSWSECQEVADLCKQSGGLYRCNVCDLVFRWPRPDPLALDRAYRSIPVTSWVHEEPPHWGQIADLIRMHVPNSNVLDIGCFRGDFLAWLGKRYELHGIEPNAAAAEVAAARGIKMIGRELDADLNPYNGKFGAVILMDVLEHVPDPLAALAKVRRLLAPGGLVVILTGDSCYWVSRLSLPFYWYMGYPIHLVYLGRRFLRWAAAKQSYKIVYRSRIPHDPASLRRSWRARLRALAVITARRCKKGSRTRWINSLRPFARLAKATEPPRLPELPDHMLVLLRRIG